MAESDYNVADRRNADNTDVKANPITAADKVAETVQATPDSDALAAAAAANVTHPAYVGYAAALTAHQNREDIESLASRRIRESGTTFAAADYMRSTRTSEADAGPGTVAGLAPREA